MTRVVKSLAALALVLSTHLFAPAASAAVVQVTDVALFPVSGASTGDFAALLAGSADGLVLFAGGPIEVALSATDGLLSDGAGALSTVFDLDTILLQLSAPITGIGLTGGILDEFFGYVTGTVTLTVNGTGYDFTTLSGGPVFFGLLSDAPFSTVALSVAAFDDQATSVAFAGLESVSILAPVPLPAAVWFLGSALGLVVAVRLRRV